MQTSLSRPASGLRGSWRRRRSLNQGLLYLALTVMAVFVLFPFYYMVISSLREPFYNFDSLSLDLLPSAFNLEPYRKLLGTKLPITFGGYTENMILIGFKNTLILVIAIVVASTLLNGLAAYAFAKRDFPGKQFFFTTLLLTIILPAEVTLVTKYVMFHRWHLLNTYWALILPSLTSIFGIFLMRQFISTIPDALLEAARIDGATEFQVVTRIVFPLSTPVMATYALFTFLGVWNDLIGPLIFLNVPDKWTLQLALYNLARSYTFEYGSAYQDPTGMRMQILFAGLIIAALPTILVFVIFQRRLVSGITLSGLKG
ncbi:MAG: carbohydrate ABC transporter permease [Anaerolineae bacterium]|nr:carbohydrate ABC transporter permease [Anaerolineae bacterium]MDW8098073.1 carbohydrate ABC transporter permease [Anaerolineae bacterium]